MSIQVVIAEDDPQQLQHLQDSVKRLRPEWTIAAAVQSTKDMDQILATVQPDLLILDIHLQDEDNGFELIHMAPRDTSVIFVTGDPSFAVQAFDEAAIDYILKPVRQGRLEAALAKAEARWERVAVEAQSEKLREGGHKSRWIVASRGRDIVVVFIDEIMFFQADTKYTRFVWAGGEALLRRGISDVKTLLDPAQFIQVHRSAIVNLHFIGRVRRDEMGRFRVSIRDRDEELMVSKPFEHLFKPG
jgi:DNA-binding LytR/AlgR family response regulator